MDSTQPGMAAPGGGAYLNSRAMIVGLAFMTVGGVIGAWGLGMSGTAIMRNVRRWLQAQQPETAITEPATAKMASSAAGAAWRREMETPSPAR